MKRLFHLKTVLKDYDNGTWTVDNGRKVQMILHDVPVHWCVLDRKKPCVPYNQVIREYKPEPHMYQEDYIDELFAWDEAIVFKNFLLKLEGVECDVQEVKLPIPFDTLSYEFSLSDKDVFYELYKRKGYDLGFNVIGYSFLDARIWEFFENLKSGGNCHEQK